MMKYAYKLPINIRRYCEWEIRHYQQTKRQLIIEEQNMMPSITAAWKETPGGGQVSNPTEQTALRIVTSAYLLRMKQNVKAIESCLERLPEKERQLVEAYFFRNKYTIDGAGQEVGYGHTASHKIVNKFLYSVALEFGMVTF